MSIDARLDPLHSKTVSALVAKMLAERQEVLVLFNRLAKLKPYTDPQPVQPLLQQFCQVLMDYLALGHFEVYQCLEDCTTDVRRNCHFKHLTTDLYPLITTTTEAAVAFNDRYDSESHCQDLRTLDADLSRLGEHLADRIELEDRLIAAMSVPVPACPAGYPA